MGGAALRSGALSDATVIDLVNGAFVPVWVDVRTTPLPRFPFMDQILIKTKLSPDNRVIDAFSEGFFLRSLVVTPDGQTLLNPQGPTVTESVSTQSSHGYFAYAQVKREDYLLMLQAALLRYRGTSVASTR